MTMVSCNVDVAVDEATKEVEEIAPAVQTTPIRTSEKKDVSRSPPQIPVT